MLQEVVVVSGEVVVTVVVVEGVLVAGPVKMRRRNGMWCLFSIP